MCLGMSSSSHIFKLPFMFYNIAWTELILLTLVALASALHHKALTFPATM